MSAITLLGGVSLAVIPAATLSIATRLFTRDEQGAISVAVMIATFVGQLTFAVVVESRLSSAATERRVTFPLWLAALSVITSVVVAVNFTNPVVLCIALPVLLASLEVGRGVSVAERLDKREVVAAVAVGVGALFGVGVAYLGGTWALIPLVAGITVATIVRSLPVAHKASRPEPRVMGWVVTDVAITGIIYPLLNAIILPLLGPTQALLFAAISTVSGLLSIPLNFMRLRLLKAHSTMDIVVSGGSLVLAMAAIAVCEALGVFGFIFGSAWSLENTAIPLTVACLWRAASLATTIPFAALRRAGEVRILTLLRAVASGITFIAALCVLPLQNITWVFAVMLCGELLQTTLYELTRRRRVSRSRAAAEAP
jgi:hypothetical protein